MEETVCYGEERNDPEVICLAHKIVDVLDGVNAKMALLAASAVVQRIILYATKDKALQENIAQWFIDSLKKGIETRQKEGSNNYTTKGNEEKRNG